jgi:DNA (cytosine-5)-methyltransferase 1
MAKELISIDLFSGCGGLTSGLTKAGFKTKVAVEIDCDAVNTFKKNHKKTKVIQKNIREIKISEIKKLLKKKQLHLLAGCPPCQGFSSVRRLNGKNIHDERNNLIMEYLRFVKSLKPLTLMMENVPALEKYYLFKEMVSQLNELGYNTQYKIVNVKDYGVAQRRRRLVLVGSRLGEISVAEGINTKVTVRDVIGKMNPVTKTKDKIHQIFPAHTTKVFERIKLTPKNGGSRSDLPKKFTLECHKKVNVGFNDIYGRLRWDDYSTTITGGCLNPSKGRFLHPEKNRTITAREAAMLQSFPKGYKFPTDIGITSLALLIGNALPPKFSYIQSKNIKQHLDNHLNKSKKKKAA